MTSIVYDVKGYTVTVEGHANSGEYGHDLVCAAVSALTHTLRANLEQLDACGALDTMTAEIEPGRAHFAFRPTVGHSAFVRHTVTAVCVGFEVLSREAGEFISYQVVA